MEVCVMEFNLDKDAPIGVMDSGMGGISVLRELVKLLLRVLMSTFQSK